MVFGAQANLPVSASFRASPTPGLRISAAGALGGPNISTLPTFTRLLARQNSLEEGWKDVAVLAASRMPLGHLVRFPETGDLGPPLTRCLTSGRSVSLLGLSPSIFSAA